MKIGFIGCGNMGEAMLKGLLRSNQYKPDDIYVITRHQESLTRITEHYHIHPVEDMCELINLCQMIILATKPQDYPMVLKSIRPFLTSKHILISITPAFTLEQLRLLAGDDAHIVRTMPNTPVKVNQGVTGIAFNVKVEPKIKDLVTAFFTSFGVVLEVEEDMLALVGTLSGSMPAFFMYYIRALLDYGHQNGSDEKRTRELVLNTLKGTLAMVVQSDDQLSMLIDQVCSKGGSTIEGIKYFQTHQLSQTIQAGLEQTTVRFKAMEKENKSD